MFKLFITFFVAIYVVFSTIAVIDTDWIIMRSNQQIAMWLLDNQDTVYTVKIINFIICYFVSILTFYAQGFSDGKRISKVE